MKKKNIFLASAIASLTLTMSSCGDDFLERTPSNSYTAETFYSSDDAVLKAVEPLYNRAWFNFNRRALIGMGSYRANDAWNPYVSAEFARFQLTGLTEDLGLAWSALYVVVSMSNSILSDIPAYATDDVSQSVKDLAMGEAYLMRATAYFYLLRGWGDVILYEDNVDASQVPVRPLNTEASVLKFIIRDLERAVALLPEASRDHHATKYAAEGMLAKVLLAESGWNKGGTRDEATLRRVVSLCDDVINNGPYRLLDNYEDLYKYAYNDNDETLLAMRWADPLSGEWGAMNATYSDLAFPEISDVNVWGGNLQPTPDMIDYYNEEVADSFRLRATFFTPGRYYSYVKSEDGGYTYNHNWMQCKKGVVGTKADCNGHLAQMASPMNTYIQRLADVYLIKAEALLGNNSSTSDPEALKAFNATRLRAKLPAKTSFTLDDLIRERRIEFCLEYTNWFDMVTWYRWKPQYMLDFFNNKQHRGFEIREGNVLMNKDRTLSYRVIFPGVNNWYLFDDQGHCYWNDCLRMGENDNTIVQTKANGYVYDLNTLLRNQEGYVPIVLSEMNIFMPYPESDVLQNKYFNEDPQEYDFGSETENTTNE